ncbi:hypothetical protein EZ456_24385 [Pedobacter psychrodurus]|uniref:Uncharacterized protein n=1 Tax=Pedobacter psychrodurus TaxID=2530456 RepID=A0A4R0PJD1_9SPHI|nr:hypothetical protein [Pedobacter psychrodurus]TCD15643.1 hypothetical protein EZ456_24385 [Pedobacter psychrodurus]
MKQIFITIFTIIALTSYGQDKNNYVHFNKLTEVEGTDYVIASVENWGKVADAKNKYLLFINTKNGQTKQVDFPGDGYFEKIEQVKIDNLGINQIIISAQTIDLDEKKGIDWNDPKQIIILSPDGQKRTQLTDNKLFVRNWVVNKQTGTIVVTGYVDTNNNNKYDKTDKSEILIYDLKTLKQISKI